MDAAAEATQAVVRDDTALWAFLGTQTAQVSALLAYRSALRALPDAALFESLSEETEQYTLAACRACLLTGMIAANPDKRRDTDLREAAAHAIKATTSVRRLHNRLDQERALAADAMVRVISALECAASGKASEAAELAGHAMAGSHDAYADCGLPVEELLKEPIVLDPAPAELVDQLGVSDAWAFWRTWHEEACEGRHLPWTLQAEIARMPEDAWTNGADVMAMRIGRVLARLELKARIELLMRRMRASGERKGSISEPGTEDVAASFAAVRMIQDPVEDLLGQTASPSPQPFLIQKAASRLSLILAASGKWLGRSTEGDIKDMVRQIGKAGGVSTAGWIEGQAEHIEHVIAAANKWRETLPN